MADWTPLRDVGALLLWAALSRYQLRRARTVWRGEPAYWLPMRFNGPEINRRNHAVFSVAVESFAGAGVLLLIGKDTGWTAFSYVGAVLAVVFLLCFPLLSIVTAFNRPRAFVPPSLRDEPGSFGSGKKRRVARKAGLPATDHTVELHDVRPLPDDPKPFPPYFIAICSNDDCGWLSDPVDQDVPDVEQQVRGLARKHSATLVGPIRPVG